MFRASISAASAFSPASTSSIRLRPRQCRLVGKLTMQRGARAPVSNTNIRPGFTFPRSQAAA